MGGKHGFLTPKAISNRIKAKGLQKLRWYCQMCQKQCRDENGFKCHLTSEGHLRQMRIFAEDPDQVMDEYSQQFEHDFLEELSRRHNTTRVRANLVYNEFIAHKEHVHMNSTKWETLTNFVMYLGRVGKCVVDETEKGWYIQWVDRDPATLARQAQDQKKRKAELDDEERRAREIDALVQAARERGAGAEAPADAPGELRRGGSRSGGGGNGDGDSSGEGGGGGAAFEPVRVELKPRAAAAGGGGGGGGPSRDAKRPRADATAAAAFGNEGEEDDNGHFGSAAGAAAAGAGATAGSSGRKGKVKMSALDAILVQDAARKRAAAAAAVATAATTAAAAAADQQQQQEAGWSAGRDDRGEPAGAATASSEKKDYWLHEGIVVKVLNKRVGDGRFYKKKARVRKVVDRYAAEVKMLESGERLRLDQDHLETVIPQVGRRVLIVNGRRRGARAELLSVDTASFSVSVRLVDGPATGTVLEMLEYEDVCKLDDAE